MKQKIYEVHQPKRKRRAFTIEFDILKMPSPVHKYCALKNKSVQFEDKRKKKPKYKPSYDY